MKILLGVLAGAIVVLLFVSTLGGGGMMGGMGSMVSGGMMGGGLFGILFALLFWAVLVPFSLRWLSGSLTKAYSIVNPGR